MNANSHPVKNTEQQLSSSQKQQSLDQSTQSFSAILYFEGTAAVSVRSVRWAHSILTGVNPSNENSAITKNTHDIFSQISKSVMEAHFFHEESTAKLLYRWSSQFLITPSTYPTSITTSMKSMNSSKGKNIPVQSESNSRSGSPLRLLSSSFSTAAATISRNMGFSTDDEIQLHESDQKSANRSTNNNITANQMSNKQVISPAAVVANQHNSIVEVSTPVSNKKLNHLRASSVDSDGSDDGFPDDERYRGSSGDSLDKDSMHDFYDNVSPVKNEGIKNSQAIDSVKNNSIKYENKSNSIQDVIITHQSKLGYRYQEAGESDEDSELRRRAVNTSRYTRDHFSDSEDEEYNDWSVRYHRQPTFNNRNGNHDDNNEENNEEKGNQHHNNYLEDRESNFCYGVLGRIEKVHHGESRNMQCSRVKPNKGRLSGGEISKQKKKIPAKVLRKQYIEVTMRQQRLRPRCTHHLNDLMGVSSEEDG